MSYYRKANYLEILKNQRAADKAAADAQIAASKTRGPRR